MKSIIYVFSTTGNSLAIARTIGTMINVEQIVSIPSLGRHKPIECDADTIGFVFPVYHATFGEKGIPHLVIDFLDQIDQIREKYIFAVCTHSGFPGSTLDHFDQLLKEKGGKLSAGAAIRLGVPYSTIQKLSYLLFHKPLSANPENERKKQMRFEHKAMHRIEALTFAIKHKVQTFRRTSGFFKPLLNVFLALQRRIAIVRYQTLSGLKSKDFTELIHHADSSFTVSSQCNGCGICQNVCPVGNIVLINSQPKWLNACENCNACYQWCPKEAIGGKIVEFEKRYHHPDIKISDMMNTQVSAVTWDLRQSS
jgi:ferredoxin